jgi:hypothetical protein
VSMTLDAIGGDVVQRPRLGGCLTPDAPLTHAAGH